MLFFKDAVVAQVNWRGWRMKNQNRPITQFWSVLTNRWTTLNVVVQISLLGFCATTLRMTMKLRDQCFEKDQIHLHPPQTIFLVNAPKVVMSVSLQSLELTLVKCILWVFKRCVIRNEKCSQVMKGTGWEKKTIPWVPISRFLLRIFKLLRLVVHGCWTSFSFRSSQNIFTIMSSN